MPHVTVPIINVAVATPRTRLLTIDLDGHALPFRAGQAVKLGAHGQDLRKPYSIACSPERVAETGQIVLLIATEEDSSLGTHLTDVQSGSLVDVEGPLGSFTFPEVLDQPRLLFVAGGTGISPLIAMIDHCLRQPRPKRISLLYSARRGDEFAFIEDLRRYEAAGQIELHPTVTRDEGSTWEGKRGRIGRSHFDAVLHQPDATSCFICGPTLLVTESVSTLEALGVPRHHIHTERWGK